MIDDNVQFKFSKSLKRQLKKIIFLRKQQTVFLESLNLLIFHLEPSTLCYKFSSIFSKPCSQSNKSSLIALFKNNKNRNTAYYIT